MHNSVKATRLWYLTGKKHFARMIQDRETAFKRPMLPRPRKDMLKMWALFFASALGVMYSFGMFSKVCKNPCIGKQKLICEPPKDICVCDKKKSPCVPPPK